MNDTCHPIFLRGTHDPYIGKCSYTFGTSAFSAASNLFLYILSTKIAQAQWGSQPESTMFAPQGLQSILKEGGQHFAGVDEAIVKNIEACKKIGEITQTSMGPNGMNKLLVDHLDKHIVTSDTAKMLQTLEVMHPAAKLLVLAAEAAEKECGDATNFTATYGS